MPPVRSVLSDLLLGRDPRQRPRVSAALLVLIVYLAFAVVQHVEVIVGLIDAERSWPLTAWNLTGGLGFYAAIRGGWNLRLRRGRSLALPQSAWAMVGITWSYAITGPARGVVILILLLVVVCTMFELDPRQAKAVAGVSMAMIGAAMVYKGWSDPTRYDPRVEAMHFVFSAIVLTAAARLAARIAGLRTRLEAQRRDLSAALERIQALATRDELTGLANRRAALERMHGELAVRGRAEPLMSLALMDLDHFKSVNDGHGHGAGDAVLRRFGKTAQSLVRAGDLLARWGGEEFLLVMPATSATQAMVVMERLRATLRRTDFGDVVPGLTVTFSAGVAECAGGHDLEAAIMRADAAMYCAKRDGRDRAVLDGVAARVATTPAIAPIPPVAPVAPTTADRRALTADVPAA